MNRKKFVSLFAALVVGLGMAAATPAMAAPVAPAKPILPKLDTAHKPAGVKGLKGQPAMGQSSKSLTSCPSGCYDYAGAEQTLSTGNESDGASANLSVSHPYLSGIQGDYHTLTEMAVFGQTTGIGDVIELGWNIEQAVNGDLSTHLFVFSWVGGVPQSYNGGNGWANAVGCSPCVGDAITGAVGTTKAFSWEHIGTAWWAKYNGNFLGAFPDSSWSGGFTKAKHVQVFGEIAANNTKSCSDMGSGAVAGTGASGDVNTFALINSATAASLSDITSTEPTAWSTVDIGTAPFVRFRYGGPGFDSVEGVPGANGSCAPATAGTPAASSFQIWKEACPDSQTVTGCNSAAAYTTATAPLNTCVTVSGAAPMSNAVHNNSGVSGRTYLIYKTAACSGASTTVTNGTKFVLSGGFENGGLHGIKRTF